MQKKKILVVSHGTINNDSGLGRVHLELMHEYKKHGFEVDKVDYSDLYPNGQNKFQRIFGTIFTKKLFDYLKKNAYKYDIIDANFENVIFPKNTFGFTGLLFVRSHGIRPLYIAATEIDSYANALKAEQKQKRSVKHKIGDYMRSFYKDLTIKDFYLSLKYADIVHCLNKSELKYFLELGVNKSKLVFIPNGLPKGFLDSLYVDPTERKSNVGNVCYLGSWGFVKGIKDWRRISNLLLNNPKFKKISILGSVMSDEFVKRDFDTKVLPLLNIVQNFKPTQLPSLFKEIKVGIFPSYMEGFGFAVLEQLAAGIPVVAYEVPGVTDMLEQVDKNLLAKPGDIEDLVAKATMLLNLNDVDYEALSHKCILISKKYVIEDLAYIYVDTFEKFSEKANVRY